MEGVGYKLELPPPRHEKLVDFRVLVIDTHPLRAMSTDAEPGKDILPKWGNKDIAAISSKDVRALQNTIGGRSEIVADTVLLKLRAFFRWAIRQELITNDPTSG